MRWKLRDDYFNGKPGPRELKMKTDVGASERVSVEVDKDGYFEISEPPKTFSLGIFAKPASDWVLKEAVFFKKTLIDGTRANGLLMRRRVNGEWQYRKLTSEETESYVVRSAW